MFFPLVNHVNHVTRRRHKSDVNFLSFSLREHDTSFPVPQRGSVGKEEKKQNNRSHLCRVEVEEEALKTQFNLPDHRLFYTVRPKHTCRGVGSRSWGGEGTVVGRASGSWGTLRQIWEATDSRAGNAAERRHRASCHVSNCWVIRSRKPAGHRLDFRLRRG